jgi:hypothetical protein
MDAYVEWLVVQSLSCPSSLLVNNLVPSSVRSFSLLSVKRHAWALFISRAWWVVAVGQIVAHGARIAQRGQVARGVVRVVWAVGMDAAEAWREKRAYAHVSYYLILKQKMQQSVRCAKTLCPLCSHCVLCSCRVHRCWCKSPGVELTISSTASQELP